jgi:hypothetical protein
VEVLSEHREGQCGCQLCVRAKRAAVCVGQQWGAGRRVRLLRAHHRRLRRSRNHLTPHRPHPVSRRATRARRARSRAASLLPPRLVQSRGHASDKLLHLRQGKPCSTMVTQRFFQCLVCLVW